MNRLSNPAFLMKLNFDILRKDLSNESNVIEYCQLYSLLCEYLDYEKYNNGFVVATDKGLILDNYASIDYLMSWCDKNNKGSDYVIINKGEFSFYIDEFFNNIFNKKPVNGLEFKGSANNDLMTILIRKGKLYVKN